MPTRTVFLGWDKPWTKLFAEWLTREPDRLRRRLVVVPTHEAARRLREQLAENAIRDGIGAILGPRLATPDDFFRTQGAMPDAIRWAGWLEALDAAADASVASLFPSGLQEKDEAWRLAIIRQIENVRETLISAEEDFATVAQKLPREQERWNELARIEERAVAVWARWGYEDPVKAKRAAVLNPTPPLGVDEIIVAGVADPASLALAAWRRLAQSVQVTVLVGAPSSLAGTFDEWGRPKPDYWSDRNKHTTPEPTTSTLAADAAALADAVVAACVGKTNLQVAVGVCDTSFIAAVERRFREAGWPTFDPEVKPLARDGWPELLESLAEAIEAPSNLSVLSGLAQHPFFWRDGSRATNANKILGFFASNNSSSAGTGAASTRETDTAEHQLRNWFATPETEATAQACAELDAWLQLRGAGYEWPTLLRWLALTLSTIPRKTDFTQTVLALQGWLELPFDPAPHLVLAGLHEGIVPEAPPASPLLTDALHETLGLRTRQSRLARDAFLYTAMVQGRRNAGSVTVVTAVVDAQGEPCKPSRVLLQCPAPQLPARVQKFIKKEADFPMHSTPPWSRGDWKLRPPAGMPTNRKWEHLSPTTLKAYLACPTRFFFTEVLGWEKFEPSTIELNAGDFGALIHKVLCAWGNDSTMRDLSDVKQLRDCWLELLASQTKVQFASNSSPLFRLQIMSAEERLVALAEKQAEQRRLGWRVIEAEKELNGVLSLAGLPVHMKIDRIDHNESNGAWRVIDYKTGQSGKAPMSTHLKLRSAEKHPNPLSSLCVVPGKKEGASKSYVWTDLQLPLYAAAVQKAGSLKSLPQAWYALLPASVTDTKFSEFKELDAKIANAMLWANEAAKRIVAGVFWPPSPHVEYDELAAMAPEGLKKALGPDWEKLLSGGAS